MGCGFESHAPHPAAPHGTGRCRRHCPAAHASRIILSVGGRTYRSFGATVGVDEAGVSVRSFLDGRMQLPWAAVDGVTTGSLPGRAGQPARVVIIELCDGSRVPLPAPRQRADRPSEFDAASREILRAFEEYREAATSEPEDAVPIGYRIELAFSVAQHGGFLRVLGANLGLGLLLLCGLAGVIGVGGSVHSYTRDLGAYNAYRAAGVCTAAKSAAGTAAHTYCNVADGYVDLTFNGSNGHVDTLTIGPAPAGDPWPPSLLQDEWTNGPTQMAVFAEGQSGLDPLRTGGGGLSYIAVNGGDIVSLTWLGITYQTPDSPELQHRYDLAGLTSAASWTVFFLLLSMRRLRRRRFTVPLRLALVAIAAAFVSAAVIAGSAKDGVENTSDASLFGTVLIASASACVVAAIGYCVYVGYVRSGSGNAVAS